MTQQTVFEGNQTQYNIGFVLSNLGIDLAFRGSLLDVGCGKDARLVRHLRASGMQAEGIDLEVIPDPTLMRGYASNIPRPNDTYDMACSHISHFKDGQDITRHVITAVGGRIACQEIYAQRSIGLHSTIEEVMRVLKPEGRFVIWPAPTYLIDNTPSLQRITTYEEIDGGRNHEYDELARRLSLLTRTPQPVLQKVFREEAGRRAVLTKPTT